MRSRTCLCCFFVGTTLQCGWKCQSTIDFLTYFQSSATLVWAFGGLFAFLDGISFFHFRRKKGGLWEGEKRGGSGTKTRRNGKKKYIRDNINRQTGKNRPTGQKKTTPGTKPKTIFVCSVLCENNVFRLFVLFLSLLFLLSEILSEASCSFFPLFCFSGI